MHEGAPASVRTGGRVGRSALVAGGLAGGGALALLLTVRQFASAFPDDAFIVLRLARSVGQGHGWHYGAAVGSENPSTSSLNTAVLAAGYALWPHMFAVANAVFVASVATVGAAGAALLEARRRWVVGVALAAALVCCPLFLSTKGLESPMAAACIVGLLALHSRDRAGALGVVAGLAILCRPDLAAFVVVVVAWRVAERRPVARTVALAAATWVPVQLGLGLAVGELVPGSVVAKLVQGRSTAFADDRFATALPQRLRDLHSVGWFQGVAAVAAVGLVVAVVDPRVRRVAGPAVVAAAVHFAAFAFVLRPPGYHWYYVPELVVLALLASIGTWWVAERSWLLAVGGAALAIALLPPALAAPRGPAPADYVAVGRWLERFTPPGSSVASTEIGTIGWYSQRPMVDYLGLLDARAADDLADGDLAAWIERDRPDYWVVQVPFGPLEVPAACSATFRDEYVEVPLPPDVADAAGRHLAVFHRSKSAGPPLPTAPCPP